jgi:hypothetical protein
MDAAHPDRRGPPILLALAVFALLPCACVHGDAPGSTTVVSLSRVIDVSRPDADLCSGLALSKAEVARYFALADAVDGITFHDEAVILPCKFEGTLRRSGRSYHWEILAGGAGYLFDGKSVNERYLCRERCLKALPGLE